MYQQLPNEIITGQPAQCIKRLADNAFIPFDPANTDYQQFLSDISNGAPLQDSDGNTMTPEAVAAFIESLGA